MASIGLNIKRMREERGITQRQLSAIMKISQQTISSWEQDRTEPNFAAIKLLTQKLNCTIDDIVGDSGKSDILSLADFTSEEREQIKRFCAYIRYMRGEKK